MNYSEQSSNLYEITPPAARQPNARRQFLQKTALVAGSLGLLATPFGGVLAQTPPDPDPNENCFPPGLDPNRLPTPVIFTPDLNLQPRVRKSIWDLTDLEIDRLKAAYAALRALPDDDPRGWLAQAHVHCYYCWGSQGDVSNIDIHGGWHFFPWHRCYLYFHERILGSLIGDPTFALPYWDWDNPSHATIPPAYDDPSSPLFDAVRQATASSTPTLADILQQQNPKGVAALLQESQWQLYMGNSKSDSSNSGTVDHGGHIEDGPHGLVHIWTADPSMNQGLPDMGILQTAARDPIFYAHHCNIDRLWYAWNAGVTPATAPHDNPTETAWQQKSWNFFDVAVTDPSKAPTWTAITIANVLDIENSLRYIYQPPALQDKTVSNLFLVSPRETTRQETAPTTRELALHPDAMSNITAPPVPPVPTFILHIDGIETPPDKSAIVRVFVNQPDATAATPTTSETYVGYFVIVAKRLPDDDHTQHRHPKRNVALNITAPLMSLLEQQQQLTVTLVPVNGFNDTPEAIDLTYEHVYVTIIQPPK